MKPHLTVCDRCSAEHRSDEPQPGWGNWATIKTEGGLRLQRRLHTDGSIAPNDLCPSCVSEFKAWWVEKGAGHLAIIAFIAWAFLGGHAQAHCYSVWKFPHAQRCGGSNRPPVVSGIAKRMTAPVVSPSKPEPSFDIPLPDPDPATTALRERLQ